MDFLGNIAVGMWQIFAILLVIAPAYVLVSWMLRMYGKTTKKTIRSFRN